MIDEVVRFQIPNNRISNGDISALSTQKRRKAKITIQLIAKGSL
jgi:hypothetical protein